MPALSKLACRLVSGQLKPAGGLLAPALRVGHQLKVPVRNMGGHERRMEIRPTQWEWRFFKDQLHLYVMMGVIPLGIIITYANLFIGPAKLVDTPEGYEPKCWEYHSHPIRRWFARYCYDPPEKHYERMCASIDLEMQKAQHKLLCDKIERLQGERGDYYGFFYLDSNAAHRAYRAREFTDDRELDMRSGGIRTS